MKLKSLLIASIFICTTAINTDAQKLKGQSNFTIGTSFSLTSFFINIIKEALNTSTEITAKSIPAVNAMYDFGLSESFSVGAAFSYQQWTAEYGGYYNSNGDTVVGNFKDKMTRTNFGIRPLFHFGENENLDMYMGARLSFTQWGYSSDSGNGKTSGDIFAGANPIKFQALFGMRYFFTENVGFNMELAVGPTYYAMFGVNLRFGGM